MPPHHDLLDYLGVILPFIVGIATVAVLVFQLLLLNKTDRSVRLSARAAVRQAQISRQLVALTSLQTDILGKQKELQRTQYLTQHSPHLRVRNFTVPSETGADIFQGRRLKCSFHVDNVGGMDATILESHVVIFATQMGLPMASPYEGANPNNRVEGTFNISESKLIEFEQMTVFATPQEAERARQGGFPTYILGWIIYRDHSERGVVHGVARRIAFCRQWDARARRFIPVGDPDYEYEI